MVVKCFLEGSFGWCGDRVENALVTTATGLIPQPHGGALKPWPKGVSGNWKGSSTAGACISNAYNGMSGLTPAEYRIIANDERESGARIAAARQWLETLGEDIAELEPFLQGRKTLKALRDAGVNTRMIKKASIRRGEDGEHITVELRHGGEALDRIADRTEGKPTQRVEVAKVDRDPSTILQDIAGLMRQYPMAAEMIAGALPPGFRAGLAAVSSLNEETLVDRQAIESPDVRVEAGLSPVIREPLLGSKAKKQANVNRGSQAKKPRSKRGSKGKKSSKGGIVNV
jgi:hypothetical protein